MAFPVPSLVSSGMTWAQFQAAGLTGLLEAVLAKQVATSAPTVAATTAATADGSSTLPSATYYVRISETNAFGETTVGPVSAGTAITSGTNHLTVTFQALKTGNTARNVYAGTASGGPFTLAGSGITAGTFAISAPLPTNSYAVAPPAVNSTAPAFAGADGAVRNKATSLIRAIERGNAQDAWRFAHRLTSAFLAGDPVNWQAHLLEFRHAHAAILVVAQVLAEAGTLIDANAGTLSSKATGIGQQVPSRVWP